MCSLIDLTEKGYSQTQVSYPLTRESCGNLSQLENYFCEAQEQSSFCQSKYDSWPNGWIIKDGDFDLVGTLLDRMASFFRNSIRTNLLITSIISKIAYVPNQSLKKRLFCGSPPTVITVLHNLLREAQTLSHQLPGFKDQLDILRRYCGTDLIVVMNNVLRVSGENKLSLNDFDANFRSSADNSESLKLAPFVSTYMILHEFAKEIIAIVFITDRAMMMRNGEIG